MKRAAFTLLELIFVIVVLGILAAVALPRLGGTMVQAHIAKAQGDVSAIRSGIASERQKNLVQGINLYPTTLDSATGLFGAILTYPVTASTGGGEWDGASPNYTFMVGEDAVAFTYDSNTGIFDCDHTNANCRKIVE